jgi:glycosyltransferase involved in cell wall biosynthesis
MRILHVVPSYIPAWRYGGPIHSVHGLCKALAARGHDVDVATTNVDGDADSDVPLGVPVDLDGAQVHYFPSTRLRRLYYSPPMYRFMKREMPRWDIVHTHSVFLWPTTAAARLARKAGKPYVLSPRGMLVKDLIARRSPLLKRSWIALFEKENIAQAAAIHVTSPVEGEQLLALGLKPKRMFDVPNGFDLPQAGADSGTSQELSGLPEDYVLFLGRISWKKGIDRLISALARVPGLALVVAGNDDEDYWPKMLKLAGDLGISGRIRYVGFVDGKQKERLIARAALLALPSYSENFGNVVLEAMALGVPVVVTPEVGLAHVVAETRSGVVAGGEPAELSAAIASLAGDRQLRRQLGDNGRAAAALYSWDNVAQRIEHEYRSVVDRRG